VSLSVGSFSIALLLVAATAPVAAGQAVPTRPKPAPSPATASASTPTVTAPPVAVQTLAGQAVCSWPQRPPTRSDTLPSVTGAGSVRAIAAPRTPLPTEAASAGVTRFSFIAYGDTRGRFDGQLPQQNHLLVVASMLRTIAARANGPDPIRFVVSSGDAVVDGRNAEQWNASFVDVVERLTTEGDLPVLPAAGNHDVTSSPFLDAPGRRQALGHFLAAFQQFLPPDGSPRRLAGYPTYGVGFGNLFVLVMDSNVADDSTQYLWVRDQLAGLDRRRYRHVVVALHHPAYSSGPHGGSIVEAPAAALRERYMPLFRHQQVDLVLAGHEHFFEHWVEQYHDGSGQPRRLDQIVSGGGGAPFYPYCGEPDLNAYLARGAAERVTVDHLVRPPQNAWENPLHYLVVHVDGDRMRVEVIGVDAGTNFQPYRSRTTDLRSPDPLPMTRP
jgi:3',5'-cyclic AMP phosphodiesterase CpdA